MSEIKLEEYVDCISKHFVSTGLRSLSPAEEKLVIESLQKIVDEYVSYTSLYQLRVLLAIDATRVACIIRLGIKTPDDMEIEIERISKKVVEAKSRYNVLDVST